MESNFTTPYLPSGELPPLRILLFRMGIMLHESFGGGIAGVSKESFLDYVSYFKEFNKTYVWSHDPSLIGVKKNGKYDGILGKICDDLGDAFLLPLPILPVAEGVAEVGPALLSFPTVIVTVPSITFSNDSVLYNLFRFKTDIVISLILSIFLFSVILKKSEGRVGSKNHKVLKFFFEGVWKKTEIMLLQHNFKPGTLTGKVLFTTTAIGIMFWYILWQNEMKADMSIMDTSRCVTDMEGLLKSNLSITLSTTDPSENLMAAKFRFDPHSNIARVYEKASVVTGDEIASSYGPNAGRMMLDQISEENLKKKAFISSQMILTLLETVVCVLNPNLTFLVTAEKFFNSPVSSLINPRYPNAWKKILFKRFVIIREMGLALKTWQNIVKDSKEAVVDRLSMEVRSSQCVFFNIPSFVESQDHEVFIVLDTMHYKSTYVLLVISCGVSLIVLLMEKKRFIESVRKKYDIIVRQKKNRSVDVVRGKARNQTIISKKWGLPIIMKRVTSKLDREAS
jgi:hypothetical protein